MQVALSGSSPNEIPCSSMAAIEAQLSHLILRSKSSAKKIFLTTQDLQDLLAHSQLFSIDTTSLSSPTGAEPTTLQSAVRILQTSLGDLQSQTTTLSNLAQQAPPAYNSLLRLLQHLPPPSPNTELPTTSKTDDPPKSQTRLPQNRG